MSVFDDNEDVPDGKFATRLLQFDAAIPPGSTTASPLPGIQVLLVSSWKLRLASQRAWLSLVSVLHQVVPVLQKDICRHAVSTCQP